MNTEKNEKKTFKGFGDINRLLDTKKNFEINEGKDVEGSFPLSWKISFASSVIIPKRERNLKDCVDGEICDKCDSRILQRNKFQHNLNKLKRKNADENGIMKPYYIQK